MIKTRLVKLLSHAKRYIVFQVLWQWLSLLCQVLMIYSASVLIEKALFGGLVIQEVRQYAGIVAGAVIVPSLSACEHTWPSGRSLGKGRAS